MSQIAPLANGGAPDRQTPAEARLRKTALQLEGLFVQRLFAAMRDTVPQDGAFSAGSAETTFTSMLDEKFAEQAPKQWNGQHSLAQALYHQLHQRLSASDVTPDVPPDADAALRGVSNPVPAGMRTPNATTTPSPR